MRNPFYLFLLGIVLLTIALVVRSGMMARKEPGRPINSAMREAMAEEAPQWSEADTTVIRAQYATAHRLHSGLLYVVRDADTRIPAFRDSASGLSASFVEESLRAGSHYTIYLESPAGAVEAAQFPPRATGRMVPWLFASTGANR